MSALMDVPRCKQVVEIPAAITRWERSLKQYAEKTGGQAIPTDWKLPILFKMIPMAIMQDIHHKYATGESKTYEGFSRMLIEMANERVYDHRAGERSRQ